MSRKSAKPIGKPPARRGADGKFTTPKPEARPPIRYGGGSTSRPVAPKSVRPVDPI